MVEPYVIPLVVNQLDNRENDFKNLLVINTIENLPLEAISEYDAMALLTKDKIVFRKSKAETRIFSLDKVGSLTINEEHVNKWAGKVIKWVKIAFIPFALLGLIFGSLFYLIYFLFFAIFYALIPLVVSRLRGNKIPYGHAYTITLFALGPVVLVDILFSIFGFMTLPFWISFLIFMVIIILNVGRKEVVSV